MTSTVEHQAEAQQQPQPQAPPVAVKQRRRPSKKLVAIVVGVIAAAVAAFSVVTALTGEDSVEGPNKENAFKVVLPEGWRAFSEDELARAPGRPLAVMRREDGTGFLVVRRSGRLPKDLSSFTKQLDK